MPRVRPMVVVSISFTISAAVFSAVAMSMTGSHSSWWMALDRDWAVASIALAGMCWLELRRDRLRERRDGDRAGVHDECRRRERALIRIASSQLAGDPTGPLQQLHVV